MNARLFFRFVFVLCGIALLTTPNAIAQHGKKNNAPNPNFLKGDTIPAGYDHDWNLGPTGARGWIYTSGYETTEARQILVTKIDKGSPADGVLKLKDVILGVGGSEFSYDPRTEFGKAISAAESRAGKGKLELEVWRNGKKLKKVIKLQIMREYSDTAPFKCAKSKRIFEQGCDALANRMAKRPNSNGIIRALNTLALLSSGDRKYLPLIKRQVQWAAKFSDTEGRLLSSWFYGPINLLLAEYTLATGDKTYVKDMRRISLEICSGQSHVGSWGHRFAQSDGRLKGYGMMNAPGLPIMLSLVLAKKAGVTDPEVAESIELSTRLMRFYTGKGSVPYGDHEPWIKAHDDNGKNGIAALLFNAMEEKESAEYFSRMSVCSYGGERDLGHTGNFFNIAWAMPSVSLSGPNASGAWMEEFSWYYDLARRWDGTFLNQGQTIAKHDKFKNWDSTGAILLGYAQARKKLYITGKIDDVVPHVSEEEAASLIADGSGYSRAHSDKTYEDKSDKELLAALASWSPIVRERAATRLAKRKGDYMRPLAKMIKGDTYSKLGVCQLLGKVKKLDVPVVQALRKLLRDDDLWVRIKAAQAIATSGPNGRVAIPDLLEMLAAEPTADDPRGMQQRYLCFALFDRGSGMLKKQSLAGIDKEALYKGVRAGLKNQGGKARSAVATIYKQLSYEEIKPLLPAIYEATVNPAPSGIMFADGVRLSGLELLAKHKIEEGIPLCMEVMGVGRWGLGKRVPPCLDMLESYGSAAKSELPKLKPYYDQMKSKPNPSDKDRQRIKRIEEVIKKIKSDKTKQKLRSLKLAA